MEHYYSPSSDQIDFTTEAYTAPDWNAVDFSIPYHAPAHDQIDFEMQPDYQAPAWDDVRFGGGESAEYTLSLAVTAPASTTRIQIDWGAIIPTVTLSGSTRGIGWGNADTAECTRRGRWENSEQIHSAAASGWQEADQKDASPAVAFNNMTHRDQAASAPWSEFDTADSSNTLPHRQPPANDQDRSNSWGTFDAYDNSNEQAYSYPPAKDRKNDQPYWHVDLYADRAAQQDNPSQADDGYTVPLWHSVHFTIDTAAYTPPAADSLHFGGATEAEAEAVNEPIRPIDMGHSIPHNAPEQRTAEREVSWGAGSWTRPLPDYEWSPGWDNEQEEPAERPEQPIIQEVYLFMPNITLYRLPDGAEFEATDVTLSTDSDSWGWRFSASLKRDADLAIVRPTSNGPVEIGCEINGHPFTILIEGYGRSRQFSGNSYTISGRSLTAWLSDPYAPKRSKAITAPYTAAALAEQELQYTGFSLQWDASDWLIPAGAYSYDNMDPIGAIKRIVEAAGYTLQSHQSDKTLIVSPRYKTDPHKWTAPSTALDAILPVSMITTEGGSFVTRPDYNRAIVAGGTEGGVIVTVTRDGTAGDELAAMITHDLITDQTAGYERGRAEIGRGGAWEELTLTTPLTASGTAPGLLLPNQLVEVQDLTETYPVRIDGTTITVQSSEDTLIVRQQLTTERRMTDA